MSRSAEVIDVDQIWADLEAKKPADEARDTEETPAATASGAPQQPKAKKTRTPSYKRLNKQTDESEFEHAVYVMLHHARRIAEARLDQFRAPSEFFANLHVASFRDNAICSSSCVTERVAVSLYVVPIDAHEEGAQRMRAATHMFMRRDDAVIAGRLGMLTTGEQERCTLHVCSPYCPFSLAVAFPEAYDEQEDDDDLFWNSTLYHRFPITSPHLPPIIYRCVDHDRFHVCANVCEYMFDGRAGTKVCPISQRAMSDALQNTFGDGVGATDQQEKSNEARAANEDDNDRRRRSMQAARNKLFDLATVTVNGVQVRRKAGVRSAASALWRRAGRSKRVTQPDQQARIETLASAFEVASCRPAGTSRVEREHPTRVSAIARVPFSERQAKYNHQFALDCLHEMYHRSHRRAIFSVSDSISRLALFGSPLVFATCCERAAAIFHHLLIGRERYAIEQSRFDKARPKAEKAVEQFMRTHQPAFATQCIATYEATLNAQSRCYPALELSAEMYSATETYYALRATMFYFGLMSLPVRNTRMMRADEIETIRTAFSFEAFCVIIYELMRTGYTVRNVVLLARDTFLIERLFPPSSVLNQMGMLHKACTNIKTLITTILKVAQPHGISMQYVADTTLPWTRIAELSMLPDPGRRVVEELVSKRHRQLHALRAVRPPTPEPVVGERIKIESSRD